MTAESDFSVRPLPSPEIAKLNAVRDRHEEARKDQQDNQRKKKRKKQSKDMKQIIQDVNQENPDAQDVGLDGDDPPGQIDLRV